MAHVLRLSVCVVLAARAMPALCGAEHVANGGFEKLVPDGSAPAQWAHIAADKGDAALSVEPGPEGGHCARVICTRADGVWGPGLGQTNVVSVKQGQWYELSFRARQEGLSRGMIAALRDITNWDDNQLWQFVYPSPLWRRFSLKFQAHSDLPASSSRLQFSFDTPGTLWLDDVSLTETERPRTPNLVDVGLARNKAPNSSFEVGTFGWGTYGHSFLVGEIDSSTAYHGKSSFRLDLSPEGLPVQWNDFTYAERGKPTHRRATGVSLVTAGYLPLTPGKPVSVSAYAKADRPGAKLRLGIVEDTGAERSSAVEVGTDWSRCVAQLTPESDAGFVRLALEPGSGPALPTVLWVDAVQLEEGDPPRAYAPALPVEIGFDTGRLGNVYHVGEKAAAKMAIQNEGDRLVMVEVHFSVEGLFHDTVAEWTDTVGAASGASERMVPLPRPSGKSVRPVIEPGFYRLRARWDTPAGPQERQFRFAVLHALRDAYRGEDTFLGQNHAFVDTELMRLTQDAGASWVRSWFVRWDDIEPERGRFDFTEADAQLDWLKSLGFNVQFCLGDPSSEWASTAPQDLRETTGAEAESQRVWWMPSDLQAYEDYVAALMGRYGDRVAYWEVFNEPVNGKGGPDGNLDFDRSYLRFLEAAGRARERTGAEVKLMGAGLDYLRGVTDLVPILRSIDVLSEHRYPGLQTAQGFGQGIRSAAERMRGLGVARPIWITEYGLYADDDPDPTTMTSGFLVHAGEDSELVAATAAAKHQVVALANGADKLFFHVGNWPIILNREHGCGFHPFFEWGGLPRKMLVTQNVLSWALPPGARFAQALSEGPPLAAYEFAHGSGVTIVAWAEPALRLPADVQHALGAKPVRVYNLAGQRPVRLQELNEYPVYILAREGPAIEAVREALRDLAASG